MGNPRYDEEICIMTKSDLIKNLGIINVRRDNSDGQWWIERAVTTRGGHPGVVHKKVTYARFIRENGDVKLYPVFIFKLKGGRTTTLQLTRLLYLWFRGDIPQGYRVVLKNPKEPIHPDNLLLMTQAEIIERKKWTRWKEHSQDSERE